MGADLYESYVGSIISASALGVAGYKDKMLSYCVGYKDGKRQDFIKIIRPK